MRVLFDHQLFSYQRYGGASKYFCELLYHLPYEVWDTTTLFSNNEYVKNLNLFKYVRITGFCFRGQGRAMNMLNKPYSLYRLLQKSKYDIFHQTHFETYCLSVIGNKPMVTTFHDVNFSTFNYNKRLVCLQRKSLERANKIITVSVNTKNDLMSYFNVKEEKIEVIYHGIELKNIPFSSERYMERPYILYVGTRNGNKNFDRLAQAFVLLNRKYPDLCLLCTSLTFTSKELSRFHELGIGDVVFHVSADENLMSQLYRDAELFVFPSLYEGFGLPILESMAAQCPVVLSNTSCFPEIANDAGAYFNPYDIDSIFEMMDKVLTDTQYRDRLIRLGNERVKFFSWEKCAQMHLNLYKTLL